MESKNLDKAMDIVGRLIACEEVSESGANALMYQEYSTNSEVYDIVHQILKRLNLAIYEYNNSLFVSAGENNRIFGYTNEELRSKLGVKLNRELYLAYFVMYCTLTVFYSSSQSFTYTEFVTVEDVVKTVDVEFEGVFDKSCGIVLDEIEENSIKQIALCWDELPTITTQDAIGARAARNSKAGFVKTVFNFMAEQNLLAEGAGRFYPTDRLKALMENYFEEYRGHLATLLSKERGVEDAAD
ncbi:MAG: DUF6063 family protein [Lachnospiraceae bacterium]